jgi:hypothetical protein
MVRRISLFLLLSCCLVTAFAQSPQPRRAQDAADSEALQRRAALRAALQNQPTVPPKPADGAGQGRQLNPQERQALREQLAQQRREPQRTSP